MLVIRKALGSAADRRRRGRYHPQRGVYRRGRLRRHMGLRAPRRPGHAGSLRHRRVQEREPSDPSRNLYPRTAPRQKRQGVQARSGSRQTARRPQGAVLPRRANRRGHRRRTRRRAYFPFYLSLSRLQDAFRAAVDQQPHRAGHPRGVGSRTSRQRV